VINCDAVAAISALLGLVAGAGLVAVIVWLFGR
jgi:hypothetical protein